MVRTSVGQKAASSSLGLRATTHYLRRTTRSGAIHPRGDIIDLSLRPWRTQSNRPECAVGIGTSESCSSLFLRLVRVRHRNNFGPFPCLFAGDQACPCSGALLPPSFSMIALAVPDSVPCLGPGPGAGAASPSAHYSGGAWASSADPIRASSAKAVPGGGGKKAGMTSRSGAQRGTGIRG